MEFDFSVQKVMHQFSAGTTQEDVCIMRGTHMRQNRCDSRQSKEISQLTAVIDKMGEASAKAQGLPQVITTVSKMCSQEHTAYFKADGKKCIGFIKVGYKKLFIRNRANNLVEM